MGTHLVPRDTNAAALAVATPAEETLREVCWFFGRRVTSARWVPGEFGGVSCGHLPGEPGVIFTIPRPPTQCSPFF